MASIGDLILRVVADLKGFSTQVEKEGAKAGEKAGKAASKGFKSNLKTGVKGGLLQGLGLGVGIGVVGLATKAIGGMADVIGDATQAALADEESQNRLSASLKSNVAGWNDNTDAIERTIKAQQRKGFDDESQRDALTVLVGATHDVAKAQTIMATAMDLARFKGISLREASEALIKVEGGQYRALKQLGIKLKDGATSTEALAAVQAVAAGQAEAYANTLEGKLLANQIKVSEAMEDFGRTTLPLVAESLDIVTRALDRTTVPLEDLQRLAKLGAGPAAAQLNELEAAANELGISIEDAWTLANESGAVGRDNIVAAGRSIRDSYDATFRAGEKDISGAAAAFTPLTDAVDENADAFKTWSALVIESSGDVRKRLTSDMDALIDDVFDEQINRDALSAQAAEMAAARRVLASGTATAAEMRDARATLHSVAKDREQTLQALASHGDLSRKEIAKHLRELQHDYEHSTGAARKRIAALIAKWKELQSLQAHTVTLTVTTRLITENAAKPRGGHRAVGGPVRKDVPYIVGERRPELFVPEVNGRIHPRVSSDGPGMGAMAGDTININVGRADSSTVHDIVWEQRRLAATRSMLARSLRR